jgi:hypothetical protein
MNAYSSNMLRKGLRMRAERAPVSLSASVVTMSAYQFPRLANISQTGARLIGSPLPPRGAEALLRSGTLEVLCRVVWAKEGSCGVRFDEAVSPRILKQVQLDGQAALETRDSAAEDRPEPMGDSYGEDRPLRVGHITSG